MCCRVGAGALVAQLFNVQRCDACNTAVADVTGGRTSPSRHAVTGSGSKLICAALARCQPDQPRKPAGLWARAAGAPSSKKPWRRASTRQQLQANSLLSHHTALGRMDGETHRIAGYLHAFPHARARLVHGHDRSACAACCLCWPRGLAELPVMCSSAGHACTWLPLPLSW